MTESIDLTALFDECETKGGFKITAFNSGLTKDSGNRATVLYNHAKFQINANFRGGFKALYEEVLNQYQRFLEIQLIIATSETNHYNRLIKEFKEFRSKQTKNQDS